MITARYRLDAIDAEVEAAVARLIDLDALGRLFGHDHTLWQEDPADCADRLGWTDVAWRVRDEWDELSADRPPAAAEADHVLLMGMGGSSLFPEVLARTLAPGRPVLRVLDTTHPVAVARVAAACPPGRTFFVGASKSGSTVETRSHLAFFADRVGDPRHFGVITDPGSALGADARAAGYAAVWENDPDIGGRYSALSLFGMVPAALAGVDGAALLDAALDQTDAMEPSADDEALNVGLRLGAAIGAAALAGRAQLTILLDPRVETFGLWLEQLVAESLGKHGRGAVPLVGEDPEHVAATAVNRLVVAVGDTGVDLDAIDAPRIELSLEEVTDLGAHVILWETAVALAGRVLDINPFDQPDVEAAKVAARALLASPSPAQPPDTALEVALSVVGPGDVVVLAAFVDPEGADADALAAARHAVGRRAGCATTLGFGPRFLHSTGQLHKGGGRNLVVLQVLDAGDADQDLAIPGQPFTFGQLLSAQAAGDLQALHAAGTRAFRVPIGELSSLV